MRRQNTIPSLLSLHIPLAACVALTACGTTVRDFGDGGGTSSSTSSGDGGDSAGGHGGHGGYGGGEGCASPRVVCGGGCTDTTRDPANCGACGVDCPAPPGYVATCVASVCGSGCDAAHGDCNLLPEDGCEIDLTVDVNHCGACGNPCPAAPGAAPTCQSGACGFVCGGGFLDCDGAVPGCETDAQNDRANCGGCGLACPRELMCSRGSCVPQCLTGATGDAWEPVPPSTDGNHGFQNHVPRGSPFMYVASQSQFSRYNIGASTWETLPPPPVAFPFWGAPAEGGGHVWALLAGSLIRYDPPTNAWTTVRADLHGGDSAAITVIDDAGHLWSYNAGGELVEYDPSTDVVTYRPTGVMDNVYETRLGWDRLSRSVFFGGFSQAVINRYDVAAGSFSRAAPQPEGFLNDIFCADNCGHLYAAGGTSGTSMWQYDIASDTWKQIPDFPVDHGDNGSCSAHGDGWLYVETGSSLANVFRIRLF